PDDDEEPAPAATPVAAPTAAEAPAGETSVVEQLRANAEAFSYGIGTAGGTITTATISEPLTFNGVLANDSYSSGLLAYLFEGLTEVSWLTDEVEPALAESWEHSADGLTWTFNLRRDVRWHDGEPFTARDVEFTFNRIIYNPDIPTSARAAFQFRYLDEAGAWQEAPMTVAAVDDYTVRFVLPTPFAPFLRSMGTSIYPRHILEPHVEAGTFDALWGVDSDPAEVVGTGPFTIESYTPGEGVVLVRNPDYWLRDAEGNALPYIERVVHLLVPSIDDDLAKFRAGEVDAYGMRGQDYALLEPEQQEGNFTIHRRGPAFGTTFLGFNLNAGSNPESGEPYVAPEMLAWFSEVEFRRAVAHSIDKARIIDEVQHGLGYPQWASISPAAGDFHNPFVRRHEYDVAGANAILDGLGWTDRDGDGVRADLAGNPISFKLVTNVDNDVRARVAAIIDEGLDLIGIDARFEPIDFGDLVGQLTTTYDWEAMIVGLSGGTEPHFGMAVWHSGESLHLWHPNQEHPATEWEAAIDESYVQGSQELDRELRVQHYRRAQEIAAEQLPLIYTTLSERLTAVRNVFGNTTPTLYGLWDVRYVYRTDMNY
ncbi:MAG: ABC transporter substrate-binding protein, partial [Gammaproteobacteria bacterium]|nr:ABC transporter substrate-binding protein [Gammaproteobacteria bacterium]